MRILIFRRVSRAQVKSPCFCLRTRRRTAIAVKSSIFWLRGEGELCDEEDDLERDRGQAGQELDGLIHDDHGQGLVAPDATAAGLPPDLAVTTCPKLPLEIF